MENNLNSAKYSLPLQLDEFKTTMNKNVHKWRNGYFWIQNCPDLPQQPSTIEEKKFTLYANAFLVTKRRILMVDELSLTM